MATTADLERALGSAVDAFGRFGSSYPIHLTPPPGAEVASAADVLAPGNLVSFFERAIAEWTTHPEEEDVRAAASRFVRRLCGSVASAALIPLAFGMGVRISLPRLSFLIRNGMPMGVVLDVDRTSVLVCEERSTAWVSDGHGVPTIADMRDRVLSALFADTLAPAFDRVLDHARVADKLLWATAAEQIDMLYANADPAVRAERGRELDDDRRAILFAGSVPGVAGSNPMLDLLTWETPGDPTFVEPLQVRRICCVCYVIPGRTPAYCRTCGLLTPQERLELWRSWRAGLAT